MKGFKFKTLLPKGLKRRVAQNFLTSNIKPRFLFKGFWRLKYFTIILFLLGYHPVMAFPPVQQSVVKAQIEQAQTIVGEEAPPMSLPHPGYLSTRFSQWHPGIDLATGLGMPVRPIADGQVVEVNFFFWGLGNHVVISHTAGFVSTYAHMGRVYVKKGQWVSTANILGEVGLTGHTSGPHTHLEITKNGQYVNPLDFLPPIPNYPSMEFLKPVGGELKSDLHKNLKPDFN